MSAQSCVMYFATIFNTQNLSKQTPDDCGVCVYVKINHHLCYIQSTGALCRGA